MAYCEFFFSLLYLHVVEVELERLLFLAVIVATVIFFKKDYKKCISFSLQLYRGHILGH